MLVILVLVSLFACATAAQAATHVRAPLPPYRHVVGQWSPTPVPLGGSALYAIAGVCESFDGSPLDRPYLEWGWYDPDAASFLPSAAVYHYGGYMDGAENGTFSSARVTAHPGHDALWMSSESSTDGLMGIGEWGLDFSTAAPFVLRPAHVKVSVAHAPAGKTGYFELGDAAVCWADSWSYIKQGSGIVDAAPPGFDAAVVNFSDSWDRVTSESEWTSPGHQTVAVSPGAVANDTLAFDWSKAAYGRLLGKPCQHSGRPGSSVTYRIAGLPAGEQVSFFGFSERSLTPTVHDYGRTVTSTGPAVTYTVRLQIPKNAPVGVYRVEANRSDDPRSLLQLYDYFDVSTLVASHAVVAPKGAVRLRGRLDTLSTRAMLLVRQRPAGQPESLHAPGWTQVGIVNVDAKGRFVTPVLHPRRTSWYVLRYSNANLNCCFTSVVKVEVRGHVR